MLPDNWHLTEDVDGFLARAGDFLRSRPALHNTPLTDIEMLRTRGATGHEAAAALFGRLESRGSVRAILYLTPRGRLGLTPLSPGQAEALAARLGGLGPPPPTSSRTATPPALSPTRGSGTRERRPCPSGARTSTASARSLPVAAAGGPGARRGRH